MAAGTLYLVGTPIGNLEDITLRALRVLGEVDVIAAEDTRRTRKLLTHHRIHGPKLMSYHAHNERQRGPQLVRELRAGRSVALVSDAGMPGISDPGERLVQICIREGVPLDVIPGPSAAISALVLSGLATTPFLFAGFLPRRPGERQRRLENLRTRPETLLFYEAGNRVQSLLEHVRQVLGERKVAVARELTKVFQEVKRADVSDVLAEFEGQEPRGEFVVMVEGQHAPEAPSEEELRRRLGELLSAGMSRRDAARLAANELGAPKRHLYDLAGELAPGRQAEKKQDVE